MFGIDWKDILKVGGTLLGAAGKHRGLKEQEEVAKYNREVDVASLHIAMRQLVHDQALADRGIADARFRATVAASGVQQAEFAAGVETQRRSYLAGLAESEASRREALARGRFDVAAGRRDLRLRELLAEGRLDALNRGIVDVETNRDLRLFDAAFDLRSARSAEMDVGDRVASQVLEAGRATRAQQRSLLDVETGTAAQTFEAGRTTRAAQRRGLAATTAAAGRTIRTEEQALQRTSIAARGSIGAQRRGVEIAGRVGRVSRTEEAYLEAGAAQAGEAARGVIGSGSAIARSQEQVALQRDLGLQMVEQDMQMAGLLQREVELETGTGVEAARLGQRRTELHREREVQGAQLAEAEIRAGGEYAVGAAQRSVRGARLEEEDVAAQGAYDRHMAQSAVGRASLTYDAIDSETGLLVSQAQRSRRYGELDERRGVRALQESLARTEGRMAETERDTELEAAMQRRAKGILDVADSDVRQHQIQQQRWGYESRQREQEYNVDRLEREKDMAVTEHGFAQWQLERLPSVPNFGRARTELGFRSLLEALGH